jgi:hypothetical protein
MRSASHIELTCRRQDQGRFEALGLVAKTSRLADSRSALVVMVDEEGSLAPLGRMPVDIPYYGVRGSGVGFNHTAFACDGEAYAEVETRIGGGFLVDEDEALQPPTVRSLKSVLLYIEVRTQVLKRFEEAERQQQHPSLSLFESAAA